MMENFSQITKPWDLIDEMEDRKKTAKNNYPDRCFRLPETGGSRWKESGNLSDPTGKYRNNNPKMEAVFRSYVLGILPMTSSPFPPRNSLENGYKSSKHGYNSSGNCRTPSGKIR